MRAANTLVLWLFSCFGLFSGFSDGVEWCKMVCYGVEWWGMEWNGMVWYGMVSCGVKWNGATRMAGGSGSLVRSLMFFSWLFRGCFFGSSPVVLDAYSFVKRLCVNSSGSAES